MVNVPSFPPLVKAAPKVASTVASSARSQGSSASKAWRQDKPRPFLRAFRQARPNDNDNFVRVEIDSTVPQLRGRGQARIAELETRFATRCAGTNPS